MLVRSGVGPGLRGRDLTVFEQEIIRLEKLIQSFLDFARPPQAAEKVSTSVRWSNGRRASFRPCVPNRRERRGSLASPTQYGPTVDPDLFRQLLLNLLLNALEAVRPGGVVGVTVENTRRAA